jgi:quercetin dioxygenase-like cupin family protein
MPITTLHHFRRARGGEHSREVMGSHFTFLADAADTGAAYSLIEASLRPGDEPPPHVHTGEDEAYYILDGHFTFRCGETVTSADPGSLVFLPRGLPHSFTVDSESRALVIISPGGLDNAFRELSGSTPPPVEHVLDVMSRFGVGFAPPPGAVPTHQHHRADSPSESLG